MPEPKLNDIVATIKLQLRRMTDEQLIEFSGIVSDSCIQSLKASQQNPSEKAIAELVADASMLTICRDEMQRRRKDAEQTVSQIFGNPRFWN